MRDNSRAASRSARLAQLALEQEDHRAKQDRAYAKTLRNGPQGRTRGKGDDPLVVRVADPTINVSLGYLGQGSTDLVHQLFAPDGLNDLQADSFPCASAHLNRILQLPKSSSAVSRRTRGRAAAVDGAAISSLRRKRSSRSVTSSGLVGFEVGLLTRE